MVAMQLVLTAKLNYSLANVVLQTIELGPDFRKVDSFHLFANTKSSSAKVLNKMRSLVLLVRLPQTHVLKSLQNPEINFAKSTSV